MFHSPWWFLLLLLLPFLAFRLFTRRRASALRYSSISVAGQLPRTVRQRLMWLPKVLTLLVMLLMIIGLARPREGREQTVVDSEGIAIELVVDRSGSMRAMDFKIDGESVDRLTAIKNVAGKFVLGKGEDELDGRFNDLIGLVTFAGYADGITPPTLDHTFLVASLNDSQIVSVRGEDGTAIGDAIALAVEKLNALDEGQDEKVKSKIIILLTDGENTAGDLEPIAAAEIAKTMGIKVYTIGVGTEGQAPIPIQDVFGRERIRMMQVTIDEETLRAVAETTGGKYFRATDTDSLTDIYTEIDQLEKTKVESEHYVDYRELAVQSYQAGGLKIPPIFLMAFTLLIVKIMIENLWLMETTA